MNWTDTLRARADLVYKAAHGLIEELDDADATWTPTGGTNWLNGGQLIRHITNACGNTANGFVTGKWMDGDHGMSSDWKPSEAEQMPPARVYLSFSQDEALAALAADHAAFLAAVAEAGEERLASERTSPPWGGPEMNLGGHLLTCIDHLQVHKAQLFYYLKMQGKPVGTEVLWGM